MFRGFLRISVVYLLLQSLVDGASVSSARGSSTLVIFAPIPGCVILILSAVAFKVKQRPVLSPCLSSMLDHLMFSPASSASLIASHPSFALLPRYTVLSGIGLVTSIVAVPEPL